MQDLVLSFRYDQARLNGCEVKLNYTDISPTNKKRCPYFYGSQEYGNNLSVELTYESWEQLEKKLNLILGTDNRLNIFENGVITISHLWYNGRNEEWEEEEIYKFENKEKIIEYINYMFAISPMRRQCDNITIGTYEELIEFLKKGNF